MISDNFSTLQMKGHVLHRARVRGHLKVPGLITRLECTSALKVTYVSVVFE